MDNTLTQARDTSGNMVQIGNPALNPQFDYTKPIDVNAIKPISPFIPPTFTQPSVSNGTGEAIAGLTSAISSLNNKGAAQSQAEAAVGLPDLNKQLTDITERLKKADVQSLKNQEQALQSGTTLSFAAGEAQRVARNDAIERMSLAASSEALQGRIAQARDIATKAVDEQFAPAENYLKYFGTLYSALQNDMTESEKLAAQEKQDKLKAEVEAKKADALAIQNLSIEAAKNGADQNAIAGIASAKTVQEALTNAAGFLKTANYDTVKYTVEDQFGNKSERIAIIDKKTGKYISGAPSAGTVSTANIPGTVTPIQNKAIEDAVRTLKFGSVADRKDAQSNIARLLSTGDVTGAKEALRQYVDNSVPQIKLDVIEGKKDAIRQLNNIKEKLAIFQANNGNTNIFTGLSQKALEKGGFAKDDPLINDIANSIALAIVDYRRAVSGAAFTESEKKAYDAIFPSTGNTPALNKVKFDSLVEKFNGDIEGFYKEKIGATKYNEIFQSSDPLKIGTTSIKNDPLDLGI